MVQQYLFFSGYWGRLVTPGCAQLARSLDYFWQGLGDWYAVLEMEPWSADARQALACCPISPAPASIFMTLWFVCCV